jgi:predicted patatin/cPLA2 family phospholipase
MCDLLVESICRATTGASEQIERLYGCDGEVKSEYAYFGDTELYIHGGGFSGLWAIGLIQIFQTLEKAGAMKIHILHGYSIGAIFAVFYACNFTTQQSIEAYCLLQEHANDSGLYSACREVLQQVLPVDAHTLCTDRVRIGMTQKFPMLWYHEVSTFLTRDALIAAIVSSSSIPCITTSLSNAVANYVDGVFGQTVWGWSPPRLGRTGIELLPPCLGYSYVFSPTDPYIYGLIINGLTDIIYFLQKKSTKYIRHLTYLPWQVGICTRFIDRAHWSLLQRVT